MHTEKVYTRKGEKYQGNSYIEYPEQKECLMIINPNNFEGFYYVLTGLVVPRPIAFISTISPDGVTNLAPFSFFNAVSGNPATVIVSIGRYTGTKSKDTLANIETTKEFVINIVNYEISEAMNSTAAEFPEHVDEFDVSGLTKLQSEIVAPPRVAESPAQLECRLNKVVQIGNGDNESGLVIGDVLLVHVKDEIIDGNRIDINKLNAIGRLSGSMYSNIGETFSLKRPIYQENG